ncbi:MAG: glycerol-3-phosphate 1-O-acyltransferase PlsY [Hydrogenovibrio sp.]|uniref:glycerol-3-phosphate 1-O-acyltransferase PlsY n=1 Tax=Hydrogenovibrio sp. TaxID=2065821 RepID=UPI00286FDF3E|nr:glycerol-3-phosphate 1-O-acyltransferase PlsY [Hydrogenovibrio sp.]MDR9497990.1 glycerol-3-phosphate 1-O-acyltransferase PlsY [Hydrogenovibrio sp.]
MDVTVWLVAWVVVWVLGAYLLGSISSAIVVCRLMGLGDPREDGSGNPGATNVKRLYGNRPAALTLAGDLLKGFVPVGLAVWAGLSGELIAAVALAAFFGHLYPVFFQFRGGKGVATFLGAMFGLHVLLGAGVTLVWLFVAKVLKVSSVSALAAAALAPFIVYGGLNWLGRGDQAWILTAMTVVMAVVLFWRHRSNIQRLLSGEEGRI